MKDQTKSRDVSHEIIRRGGNNDADIAERIGRGGGRSAGYGEI